MNLTFDSGFLYRLRTRKVLLAGNDLSNHGWRIKWQCWSDEDYGIRDCPRKEVSSNLMLYSALLMLIRYQSRAFLLFPMCFNVGVIIGPILGGLLADPAGTYPNIFGDVEFLKKYPYAAPNLLSAFILLCASLGVFLGLAEVSHYICFDFSNH